MKTRYIEAPRLWDGRGLSVFLAGGITGCPDWQQDAWHLFANANLDATILNPRRAHFPIGNPWAAHEQIAWEFEHLHRATVILFWFPASDGPQPIALYELGRYVALGREVAIGRDPQYPRRLDIDEQMNLAWPRTPIWATLADTCREAAAVVRQRARAEL